MLLINKFQEWSCIVLFRNTASNISHTFTKTKSKLWSEQASKIVVKSKRMWVKIYKNHSDLVLTLIGTGHRLSWLDRREEWWEIWRRSMARTGWKNKNMFLCVKVSLLQKQKLIIYQRDGEWFYVIEESRYGPEESTWDLRNIMEMTSQSPPAQSKAIDWWETSSN